MARASLGVLSALAFLATAATSVSAAPEVTRPLVKGDPEIKQIDTIVIAPDGVLLIADGASSRIVAVGTDDRTKLPGDGPKVPNIAHEIAGRLGAADKDVEIAEIALNPASGRTYVLVRK